MLRVLTAYRWMLTDVGKTAGEYWLTFWIAVCRGCTEMELHTLNIIVNIVSDIISTSLQIHTLCFNSNIGLEMLVSCKGNLSIETELYGWLKGLRIGSLPCWRVIYGKWAVSVDDLVNFVASSTCLGTGFSPMDLRFFPILLCKCKGNLLDNDFNCHALSSLGPFRGRLL